MRGRNHRSNSEGKIIMAVKKGQLRNHNEWFDSLAVGKCPNCGSKEKQRMLSVQNDVNMGRVRQEMFHSETSVWGWYNYVSGKKRLIVKFCRNCVTTVRTQNELGVPFSGVRNALMSHAEDCDWCGSITFQGHKLPSFLTSIEDELKSCFAGKGQTIEQNQSGS